MVGPLRLPTITTLLIILKLSTKSSTPRAENTLVTPVHPPPPQLWQFDQGTRKFVSQNCPSSRDIIVMSNIKSRKACWSKEDLMIYVTAHQLAQAEGAAFRQVTKTVYSLWNSDKYGHAPRKKPAYSVQIVMENFNSLCVTSGNLKINAVNNLCKVFKVNYLCGCETQVDWRQVPKAHWFHNLFGAGTETCSIFAHNINEQMHQNQFGGCAMMAMSTISSEVWNTGVDSTGLGK